MSTKVSITPSMLAAAGRCQMQIPFFHIMGLKFRPGIARESGQGLHQQLLKVDRQTFIETGKYKPIDELKEGFHTHLEHMMPEIPDEDEDVQRYGGPSKAFNAYVEGGFGILDKYNEDRSVTESRAVERSFEVPCADTTMKGRFDMVKSDTLTKDLKTKDMTKEGAKKPEFNKLANDIQFRSYAFANFVLTKEVNQSVNVLYGINTGDRTVKMLNGKLIGIDSKRAKDCKPKSIVETVELPVFDQKSHDSIEEMAYRLHKIIVADAFMPVDKSSQNGWVCQEKYCGAWKAFNRTDDFEGCPFGERSQVSVAITEGPRRTT